MAHCCLTAPRFVPLSVPCAKPPEREKCGNWAHPSHYSVPVLQRSHVIVLVQCMEKLVRPALHFSVYRKALCKKGSKESASTAPVPSCDYLRSDRSQLGDLCHVGMQMRFCNHIASTASVELLSLSALQCSRRFENNLRKRLCCTTQPHHSSLC